MSGSYIWGLGIFASGENEFLYMNLGCTIERQFGTTRRHPMCSRVRSWLLCDGTLSFLFEHAPLIACYIDIKGDKVLLFWGVGV